ncbi:MAG: HAD-IA family hydrolase [Candidatus Electronema sp. V4]|uniref:HAD-IA family hydrolase n=1 Tax=Candidatus Electronema sp. V4 TaxID=3454756 RepID=UPI0040554020
MQLNNTLWLPDEIKAILFDMDGVLLDSLGLDLSLCGDLLKKHLGKPVHLSKEFIRSIFAYHPPEFWRRIFAFIETEYDITAADAVQDAVLAEYNQARKEAVFPVNPGIVEILTACRAQGIKTAVVSNNPTEDVRKIVTQSGIAAYFDLIVGNDLHNLRPKPAPDTYIYAANLLEIPPAQCAVIEDSLLGAEAGSKASCFTIGVATGGTVFSDLEQSDFIRKVYSSFLPNQIALHFGTPTKKKLLTPNDFVSHMVEHIAWRMGCGIDLFWNSNDWPQLGLALGRAIAGFPRRAESGAALGMIDDGSAEVTVTAAAEPDMLIETVEQLDPTWFFGLRCEQLADSAPLLELLRGLAQGLQARLYIRICGVEDPHHAWEGVFRSIGIALSKMFAPEMPLIQTDTTMDKAAPAHGIVVEELSEQTAAVVRTTAESRVRVAVSCGGHWPGVYRFKVGPSIQVSGFGGLLEAMVLEAGFTLAVDFVAERLSSGHVVTEDTGLVLGKALKELLILRMNSCGVNGAGSSISTADDLASQPVSVGVSVEGRKFVKFVPFSEPYSAFRQRFLLGQDVFGGLFSEDLDDFLDGLAGGLDCSMMIHVRENIDPAEGWLLVFRQLGRALQEVFQENLCRKGIPPGVKATLA